MAVGSSAYGEVAEVLDASFFRLASENAGYLSAVFQRLPESWFDEYPRHLMSRAFVEAVRSPSMILNPSFVARFVGWLDVQAEPSPRDRLVVKQARVLELLGRGWYVDAAQEADLMLEGLHSAPRRTIGLEDLMPALLLTCGRAKMLASDLDGAQGCFAEVERWSVQGNEHPLGRYGREHLALVHALKEEVHQASELLFTTEGRRISDPGRHLPAAAALARLLIAVGQLDLETAEELLAGLDASARDGGLGWVILHAEAGIALARGELWEVIHRINRRLITHGRECEPSTLPGSVLRADLAGLYQSADDLRAADRTLRTPKLAVNGAHVVIARARQSLLLGQPDEAMSVFQRDEASHATITPARFRASGALLYASAELAITSEATTGAPAVAASVVAHSGARLALMSASTALRAQVFPVLGEASENVPSPWMYRVRVRLTQREQEVLRALREFRTVNEVAASLHVSVNTAKTHVRTLYAKLGAHNREEALWLGRNHVRR